MRVQHRFICRFKKLSMIITYNPSYQETSEEYDHILTKLHVLFLLHFCGYITQVFPFKTIPKI